MAVGNRQTLGDIGYGGIEMKVIRTTKNGIDYLVGLLKDKTRVITKAILWRIPHDSGIEDIRLKIGRYNKDRYGAEEIEKEKPRSELTLDNDEFSNLIDFLLENYKPFKEGCRKFITIGEKMTQEDINNLKAIFSNPDKKDLIRIILDQNILTDELLVGLENAKRIKAVKNFERMLEKDLTEHEWQKWFKENYWVLGSEFVEILDERDIDTCNISDYLMQAYDGFLDIIEIKRPEGQLKFWESKIDHGNYIPSRDLSKAIVQATKYIYEVEREANSVKFLERVDNVKAIKPRCVLIFGRSNDWDAKQREAYRILNSSYHNLTILTYDHVFERAKRILGCMGDKIQPTIA